MNIKCEDCKGRGVIQRDGKRTKTRKPYDLVCSECNGKGHASVPGDYDDGL